MFKYLFLIFWSLVIISCDKTIEEDKTYPKNVTFDYDGNTVTYDVIKRPIAKMHKETHCQTLSPSCGLTEIWEPKERQHFLMIH
ncbi:MAG: hypothetical protein IPG79_17020 [Saprospiraceae bacterium]|nr:hypothetical protein [Saprospiraceae bacterium]